MANDYADACHVKQGLVIEETEFKWQVLLQVGLNNVAWFNFLMNSPKVEILEHIILNKYCSSGGLALVKPISPTPLSFPAQTPMSSVNSLSTMAYRMLI